MISRRDVANIMSEWKKECGITHIILFRYDYYSHILTICTDRPGCLIGRMGSTVGKYTDRFRSLDSRFDKVSIIETDGIA